jgi:ATP-dependent helicase/nuclease subunit A
MSAIERIPDALRERQFEASDPQVSAFVAANAGAGKTHVLAQRVIRLLLDGVDPAKILCITFTKAAAANMATRVFGWLAEWIALDDAELDKKLREIGTRKVGPAERARARRLFASALDTPGGLKVQTIHAFCTRLLHQFPFEANVAARFAVLDERAQDELLDRATTSVLLDAAAGPASPLGRALALAIASAADATVREVVREATAKRDALTKWIGGNIPRARTELSLALGLAPGDELGKIEAEIVDSPILPAADWAAIAAICKESGVSDQKQCARFLAAAAATGAERVETYLSVFLTDGFEPRKNVITQPLARTHPELAQRLTDEQARIVRLREKRNAIICRDRTIALLTIGDAVIARYRAEKEKGGLLDYDDLIDKTLRLLVTVNPSWVHYKLDRGIDHVLIDEAQDTSDKQWEIIHRLVSEFTAGTGARESARTIFAVGDEKQSIFSFQGAVPRKFDEMRREFAAAFAAVGMGWRMVRLEHSFRSGPNVLGAVVEVFGTREIAVSVTSDEAGIAPHQALPDAVPGLVEIWPLMKPQTRREMEGWDAPFDALSETSPQVRLARRIADTIATAIANGEPIGHDRKPMTAGDVLILVRQRGPLFEAIIRALKDKQVAVAGADRLVLTEHVAVVDLMALTDALLLPDDDLALAVALKSPLFGLDDDQLFALAWNRTGRLRAALAEKAAQSAAFAAADTLLARCADKARTETPFAFYAWLLGTAGGRARFLRRLGHEAADALDEFLQLALDYERRAVPSLQGFMAWLRAAQTEIKRDMEITRNEVRVMTVHGAKGLEAPVVILADTTSPPTGPRAPRLIALPAQRAAPGTPDRWVWAGRKAADVRPLATARQRALDEAMHEYRRLLYVAMTRAADRLIVCGCEGQKKRPEGCWYDLVVEGLKGKEGFLAVGEGEAQIWHYRKVAEPALELPPGRSFERRMVPTPPEWLRREAPVESDRPDSITPSDALDEELVAPLRGGQNGGPRRLAMERGVLVHRLMQALPDVAPARREEAGRRYLARAGARFDASERDLFLARARDVLADARFAALFAPGSRAEVPIVGRLERPGRTPLTVSGQIDRLAVTADAVLIADYKTNHPAPRTLAEVPAAYVRQLALYRAVLQKLYPDRPVRAVLIWTDVPDLMEVPADSLEAALHAVHLGVSAA